MGVDWLKVKNEYVNTNISYAKLAKKHEINISTLTKKAVAEKWADIRKQTVSKIEAKMKQKTADVIVDKEVNRIARITSLADRLSDKLELAIEELDRTMVTHKTKTKTIEYNYDKVAGKPTKEVIEEEEKLIEVVGIIDKMGLKQLTAALKDIKDIQIERDSQADTATIDLVSSVLSEVRRQADEINKQASGIHTEIKPPLES